MRMRMLCESCAAEKMFQIYDYNVGGAHDLYDPGLLPCTGYGVPLRLATMSSYRQTDRRTDGQRIVIPMVQREII